MFLSRDFVCIFVNARVLQCMYKTKFWSASYSHHMKLAEFMADISSQVGLASFISHNFWNINDNFKFATASSRRILTLLAIENLLFIESLQMVRFCFFCRIQKREFCIMYLIYVSEQKLYGILLYAWYNIECLLWHPSQTFHS